MSSARGSVRAVLFDAVGTLIASRLDVAHFDERLVAVSDRLEPLRCADHVFCSSQVGYSKPHAEFFRSVQERLNVPPRSVLYVGDDWEADVQGAWSAGWRAVLIDRQGTSPHRRRYAAWTRFLPCWLTPRSARESRR